jgi:hypothetical protein
MSTSHNKAAMFLEGLHHNETKSIFENLTSLIEELENKSDPDPVEINLVHNIYSFLEQLSILEGNLNSYSKESNNELGNKLTSLYEKISYVGSIYRD